MMKNAKAITMLQLNVVHLDTRKYELLIIYASYTIILRKKLWQRVLNFTTRDRLTDWLFS